MILYIDTTQNNLVEIGLKNKGRFVIKKKFKSDRTQAEKLLPAVEKLLRANKLKLSDIKSVAVANRGGSFTSLRIGVVTANALAYALGVSVAGEFSKEKTIKDGKLKFKLVEPWYNSEPEITIKKNRNQ